MLDLKNLKFVIEAVKETLQYEDKVLQHLILASGWCSRQLRFENVDYDKWEKEDFEEKLITQLVEKSKLLCEFNEETVETVLITLEEEIHKLKMFLSYGAEESTEHFIEDTLVSTNNYYQIMNHLIEAIFYIKLI